MNDLYRLELSSCEWADDARNRQQQAEDELFARRVERNARFAKVMEVNEESEGLLAELGEAEHRLQEAEKHLARLASDADEAVRDSEGVARCIKRLREEDEENAAKSRRKRNKSCLLGFSVASSAACAAVALMTMSNATFEPAASWAKMIQEKMKL